MARETGSWLSGPEPDSGSQDQRPDDYPGQRLGLPKDGPGSIARMGRRIGAVCVDYLIAYGIARIVVELAIGAEAFMYSWIGSVAVALTFVLLGTVAVRLYQFTPGQLVFGLRVVSVDHRQHVGVGRALVRVILVQFVIPALFTDTDLRGVQDLATKTAVVRR
jgi:uncharacterized RDD family membrane protein YckC